MSCAALIPLKTRTAAKSRLADVLDPQAREALVQAMLTHVLAIAARTRGIDRIAVVSDGSHLLPPGVEELADTGRDLNASLHGAAPALLAGGITRLLILPGDLPLIATADLEALIAAPGAAIAPDARDEGTNALLLPLPLPIRLAFGPDSFRHHQHRLADAGLVPTIVRTAGLARDVDFPADLPLARGLASGAPI